MLGHILTLPQKRRIRAAGPNGLELRQQGGPGQGKAIVLLFGPELMEESNTVALATIENGFRLLSAEPFDPISLTDDFYDGVQTFEPFWISSHGV
jgi:hypothetical protein